jgi:hypothetical protein
MTAPLTPADADLQDFPFMPLHVARLRDSDLAAEGHPEACWYAVLLWSAAWHQLPAGSLPAADAVLARLCGLGRDLKTFRKHRADALRGWVEAAEGRLYHPVVAEQVLAAWRSKVEQRHRAECARVKKHNQRHETDVAAPDFVTFLSQHFPASVPHLSPGTAARVLGDEASKRQGEGQGQRDSNSDPIGSGAAAAPIDPEKVMFDQGRAFLAANAIGDPKAGRLLGRWKGEFGAEAVIVALGKAQREGAIEPISYIEGVLRSGKRANDRGAGGWAPRPGMAGVEPASLDDDDPRYAARR